MQSTIVNGEGRIRHSLKLNFNCVIMLFYIDLLYIFMIIDLFDELSFNCLFIFLKWIIDIDLSISCQQQENNDEVPW